MLAIRLQRIGRRGHAAYRMVVQDSHWSPKSGKVIAFLGNYDPHTKNFNFDKEKATEFVKNGAHPSPKVAQLLRKEGQKLPKWVAKPAKKSGKVRNPDKKAEVKTASPPADEAKDSATNKVAEEPAAEPTAEASAKAAETETAVDGTDEPKSESDTEAPADEPKPES